MNSADEPSPFAPDDDAVGAFAADVPAPYGRSGPMERKRILVVGGGDEVRMALSGLYDLVGDVADADLVVVSTRTSRAELATLLPALRERPRGPMVALVHTGGEPIAVEVMRAGGAGVVAEGNEAALASHLGGDTVEGDLVETYDRRVGSGRSRGESSRGNDDATNLPNAVALEERIDELAESGVVPRVAYLSVMQFEQAARKLATEATDILRRRLAVQYRELARTAAAELFVIGRADFAIVGTGLSPNRAEHLGRQLARITESFAPAGNQTLRLAMGHAGPEVSSDLSTLRELASRALAVAAEQGKSAVVSADSLSLGLASTTELEAAMRVLDVVERADRHHPGHGERVARVASELARALGFEGAERAQIRLAAHLHDIGKVGLPTSALADPEELESADIDAYRSHPGRSGAFLRASAGPVVAAAAAAHHERWDGTGFPDGLVADRIPVMARIVAVANAWDDCLERAGGELDLALARLRSLSGTVLDPTMVEVVLGVLPRATHAA